MLINTYNLIFNKKYLLPLIFIMTMALVLFRSPPFVLNRLLPEDFSIIGLTLWFFTIAMLCMFFKISKENLAWAKILGITLVAHLTHSLVHYMLNGSSVDLRFTLGLFFKYLLIFSLSRLYTENLLKQFIKCFYAIIIFIIVLSLVVYLLLLFGIQFPFYDSEIAGQRNYHVFYLFFDYVPLLVSIESTEVLNGLSRAMRFCSLLDEPGRLALVIIHLIILNELTLKSKWIRILLTFSGFFTLSVAYAFSIILFFSYKIWFADNKKKEILDIFLFFILPIAFVYAMNINNFALNKVTKDNYINRLTGENLVLNNRVEDIRHGNSAQLWVENVIFGIGTERRNAEGRGFENLFGFFATYGLIGALFYLPLLISFFRNMNRKQKILMSIILLNLLQRPEMFSVFDSIMLSFYYFVPLSKEFETS